MAKSMPVGSETQRADNSVWKKLDGGWKQLQDGDNTARSKHKDTPDPKGSSKEPGAGLWSRMREQYDLDGLTPDESVAPEHVEIDVEGDIDTKPVLKWKNHAGKVMKSYTRAFHTQRAYALHKECGKYHSQIMKAMDTLEGLMNKQDAGAATAYASMVTGHRPSVFMSLTPDKMRVYRGDVKKSHSLDYFIEKADSRDSMHPNRFHFMVEHPSQGAFIANVYDPALSDYVANGGSFAEPTDAFATVGLKDVNFSVIRAHANMRMAADAMSKTHPVKMDDVDFRQGMSAVNQVIMNVSDAVARNYGHRAAPDGMVYLPVAMSVAAVDEAGGHRYWPDTFKKREPYVENRGDDMAGIDAELDDIEVTDDEDGSVDPSELDQANSPTKTGLDVDASTGDEDEDVEKGIADGDQDIMKSYDGINFTPPAGVRAACRAGLKLKEEGHGGKGLVGATVAWARRLAAGQKISPAKARKMNAWFARHSVGSSSKTLGDKTSPAWVAWQLWGGNAGKAWSSKLVKQMESRESTSKSAAQPEVALPSGVSDYLTPKYLKGASPDVLKSIAAQITAAAAAASPKEPQCEISLSEEKTFSNEPSPTPSQSPIEKSSSTMTTVEASSKIVSPSPEPSTPPVTSVKPKTLLDEPKVRQVLVEGVLATLRGALPPMSVVEALGAALTNNFDGMLAAIRVGFSKAGTGPGPAPSPDGTVSRYADGTVVEKRGGRWHEVGNKRAKPDKPGSSAGGPKNAPATEKPTKKLLRKYLLKIEKMKQEGAAAADIEKVKKKAKNIKQQLGKSQSLFDQWVEEKGREALTKATDYCKYMGYRKSEQLIYAVSASDTPAYITVAVKVAVKAFGKSFHTLLEKELSK